MDYESTALTIELLAVVDWWGIVPLTSGDCGTDNRGPESHQSVIVARRLSTTLSLDQPNTVARHNYI